MYRKIIFIFVVLHFTIDGSAQNKGSNYSLYQAGFQFNSGIYTSFQEFKTNNPLFNSEIEKRRNDLIIWDDSSQQEVIVHPDSIWGYSKAGNIYISYEGAYWRIINIGQLSQFTAIIVRTYRTVDAFGFPIENSSKTLAQLFLDFNNGDVYELTANNLEPFIKREPQLANQLKKIRNKKTKDLILLLKAFNQLHPIYFPTYE